MNLMRGATEAAGDWWWLSFADAEKPEGEQFLGLCIVLATAMSDAVSTAWRHGCNPGGEVMGFRLPVTPKPEYTYRLIPKDEARRLSDSEDWVEEPIAEHPQQYAKEREVIEYLVTKVLLPEALPKWWVTPMLAAKPPLAGLSPRQALEQGYGSELLEHVKNYSDPSFT